jgi:SAM-dependent methyltransferase
MLHELSCTTCNGNDYVVRYEARLPQMDALDFAARRAGRRFHPRIVQCRDCGQVYSNPYFDDQLLVRLYRDARYITEPQLENMTRDYLREFGRAVGPAANNKDLRVLEVGCADGFFLSALKRAGYRSVKGIEPGREAVSRAAEDIRPHIVNDFFGPDTFPPETFDVVCCFQVMDHPSPAASMRAVHRVLTQGGVFLAINHDIRAPITQLLGERSPMYDVEHIYLFDRSTITRLLSNAGFDVMESRSLTNSYTLDYALKMFPFPTFFKTMLGAVLSAAGMSSLSLRVPGGNIVTIGRRR